MRSLKSGICFLCGVTIAGQLADCKKDGAVRNPDGDMSEVSLKPVKGSFSELVYCERLAVSWRSVLRLDYSAVNLQRRLFAGENM